jgi:hypothetical protein
MISRTVVLGLGLIIMLGQPCLADELTAAKRADIEKLLQMTGSLNLGKQMGAALVEQYAQSLRKLRPDVPQRVIEVLPDEVMAVIDANMGAFKDKVVPLYDKYFTAAEIKAMIAFYSTDLGKKTITVMPALMGESIAVGQQWGGALGPQIDARVKARLKKEGIEL